MKLLQRETSQKKYIEEIDGLRFIAIFSVVIMHLSERIRKYNHNFSEEEFGNYFEYFISRGTVGVFLFFAISGFILGLPFAKAIINNKAKRSYLSYVKKRLVRIEPPYVFWMTIFFVAWIVTENLNVIDQIGHFLASIFYVHNLTYNTYSVINPVAWSLEVELQFYLLAPFLAKMFFSFTSANVRKMVLATVIILFPVLQTVAGWHVMPIKGTLLGHLDYFLIGFFVVDIYLTQPEFLEKKSWIWDFTALGSFILMYNTMSGDIVPSILMNFSILLLIVSGFKGHIANKFVTYKWTSIIGGMCYTIYLVHLPLFEFISARSTTLFACESFLVELLLQTLLMTPILLVIVFVGFVLIEKPFMTLSPKKYYVELLQGLKPKSVSIHEKVLKTNFFLLLLLAFFLLGNTTHVEAQSQLVHGIEKDFNFDIVRKDLDDPSKIKLLPLKEMLEMAENNSPLLKVTQYQTENIDIEMKMLKKKWMEYISLTGNYTYGTSAFLDQAETVFAVDYTTLTRKSLLYFGGVTLRMPISELVATKPRTKQLVNERKILELQRDQAVRIVRQDLIMYYNDYHNKLDILELKNNKYQGLQLSVKYAEEALLNGNLQITEYNRIMSSNAQLEEEITQTKSEILLAFLMLCELTGNNIRI